MFVFGVVCIYRQKLCKVKESILYTYKFQAVILLTHSQLPKSCHFGIWISSCHSVNTFVLYYEFILQNDLIDYFIYVTMGDEWHLDNLWSNHIYNVPLNIYKWWEFESYFFFWYSIHGKTVTDTKIIAMCFSNFESTTSINERNLFDWKTRRK